MVRVGCWRGWGVYEAVGDANLIRGLPECSGPLVFPFIIPKSSWKVSLILSCVGLNDQSPEPPSFTLPSLEGIIYAIT